MESKDSKRPWSVVLWNKCNYSSCTTTSTRILSNAGWSISSLRPWKDRFWRSPTTSQFAISIAAPFPHLWSTGVVQQMSCLMPSVLIGRARLPSLPHARKHSSATSESTTGKSQPVGWPSMLSGLPCGRLGGNMTRSCCLGRRALISSSYSASYTTTKMWTIFRKEVTAAQQDVNIRSLLIGMLVDPSQETSLSAAHGLLCPGSRLKNFHTAHEDTLATCEILQVMADALPMDEMLRMGAEVEAGRYTL